jgi:ketosteroid isomerase-like protein
MGESDHLGRDPPLAPLDTFRAICAAWNRLDVDALAALFDDDGVFEDPLLPEAVTGPDAVREASRGGMAALSACEVTLTNSIQEGDLGMTEGWFRSTLADGGAAFDFPFVMVVELRDGKIARLSEYFDTKPLA